jgi:hypothetical protein
MITLSTWALVAIVAVSHDDKRQEEYLVNGIPPEVQQVIHDHSKYLGIGGYCGSIT